MINNNSRYVSSSLVTVPGPAKTDVIVITPSKAVSYTFTYSFYTTNGSDRVDTIANAFYGDPTLWWKIGDANPEVINWNNLEPGTTLRIPNA